MKNFIILTVVVFLTACQVVPFQLDPLYAEIDAATAESKLLVDKTDSQIADDTKRLDKALARLERYEVIVEKATAHYENRQLCRASGKHIWFCNGGETYDPKRPPRDSDALVKVYRRDDCMCTTPGELRDWLRRGF